VVLGAAVVVGVAVEGSRKKWFETVLVRIRQCVALMHELRFAARDLSMVSRRRQWPAAKALQSWLMVVTLASVVERTVTGPVVEGPECYWRSLQCHGESHDSIALVPVVDPGRWDMYVLPRLLKG
jgi:hypothetical protein